MSTRPSTTVMGFPELGNTLRGFASSIGQYFFFRTASRQRDIKRAPQSHFPFKYSCCTSCADTAQLLLATLRNFLNEIHNAPAQLTVLDLCERFDERQSVMRAEKLGYIVRH